VEQRRQRRQPARAGEGRPRVPIRGKLRIEEDDGAAEERVDRAEAAFDLQGEGGEEAQQGGHPQELGALSVVWAGGDGEDLSVMSVWGG